MALTELAHTERALAVLDGVMDPEVPVLSVRDLGIVREVDAGDDGSVDVVLTPTYSGCPATEVIADAVKRALEVAGFAPVQVTTRLSPAWTTDWISAAGREKLHAYGIVPPGPVDPHAGAPVRFMPRRAGSPSAAPLALACPRCASTNTERLSAFGSTACKALWRCRACGEPFEHFKPL
jgi:ring-1,2-phenylacetyl-CoA epoxidase subunit PaaD